MTKNVPLKNYHSLHKIFLTFKYVLIVFISLGNKSPLVRKLFFTDKSEHPVLKGIGGFMFGVILGISKCQTLTNNM